MKTESAADQIFRLCYKHDLSVAELERLAKVPAQTFANVIGGFKRAGPKTINRLHLAAARLKQREKAGNVDSKK